MCHVSVLLPVVETEKHTDRKAPRSVLVLARRLTFEGARLTLPRVPVPPS